jgi:head-tail adaptor
MAAISRFFVHPVTLLEPTTTETRYGDTVSDWSAPTRTDEVGWFTQVETEEMAEGREALTDTYELTLPADSAINAAMRVEYEGATFEIRGSVRRAQTPEGSHHVIARLRRVSG